MFNFSIVIVNYNTFDLLNKCLNSIIKYASGANLEIIVIDNNSNDGSQKKIPEFFNNIRLIQNTRNIGFGAACNKGIKESNGKYIVLLNSDCEIIPETFTNLKKILFDSIMSERVAIIGGKILNPDGSLQYSYGTFPTVFSTISDIFKRPELRKVQTAGYDQRHTVDWVTGAFMIIKRDLFSDIGYFDENYFMYYEETDLCFRAKSAGWQTLYDPKPQVIHKNPHAAKKETVPLFIQSEIRKSHLYFFKKNRSFFSFNIIALASLMLLGIKWTWSFIRGNPDRSESAKLIKILWQTIQDLLHKTYSNSLESEHVNFKRAK